MFELKKGEKEASGRVLRKRRTVVLCNPPQPPPY